MIHTILTSVTSVLLLFAISTNDVCKADVTIIELIRDIPKAHFLQTSDDGTGVFVGVEGDHPIYSWPKGTLLGKPTLISKQRWKETHADPRSTNRLVAIPRRLYSSFNGLLIVDTNQLVRFEINLSSIRFAHIDDYEISPDNRLLAVTAKDVLIYDMMTMEQVAVLPRPKVDCNATTVAFSPDARHLIVTNGGVATDPEQGGYPFTITRWRLSDFTAEQTEECKTVPKQTLVTPDGKTIILNPEGLLFFDFQTLRLIERKECAVRNTGMISYSPNRKYVVIPGCNIDSGLEIVDAVTWKRLAHLPTKGLVGSTRFLADDSVIFRHVEDTTQRQYHSVLKKWTWKEGSQQK